MKQPTDPFLKMCKVLCLLSLVLINHRSDWLADLLSSMPDDTIPLPPMNPIVPFAEEAPPSLPVPPQTPISDTTSTRTDPPSEVTIGDGIKDLYSSSDGRAKTILKAGYIWKKNNTGFRNWKFRWMVLTPFQLKSVLVPPPPPPYLSIDGIPI
jgi:hypothetical protein